MEGLRKAGTNAVSAKKRVARLIGEYTPPKDLPALKYGREMETIAKAFYLEIFKKSHKDVKYHERGPFIHETKQFLGASPDLLVKCSCCGKGILEVKCPFCVANDIPTDLNLDYLEKINEEVTLKTKHSYYAQVQGQLGVTKREWCHFLVYTKKGYHLERIQLDKDYWLSLQFFTLVLRKSLEACFKVKAINTCRNEQSSFFKWTILYSIAAIEH